MIERLYIHNYKGFVNFEMKCGPFVFLMGRNGSGKSSVLEVLEKLARLIAGEDLVKYALPQSTWCRYGTFSTQSFELSIRLEGDLFCYRLELEPAGTTGVVVVRSEQVTANNVRMFAIESGTQELCDDTGAVIASFPHGNEASGVGLIDARKYNQKLSRFQAWAGKFLRLQIDPWQMGSQGLQGRGGLDPFGRNFPAWLDRMAHADTERLLGYFKLLGEVLPGFKSINWRPMARNLTALEAVFDSGEARIKFELDELSEGQKCLIALYAVLHFGLGNGGCVAFDEPDNFLALPEIEPFLNHLEDAIDHRGAQAFLVSHHPEFYNRLATDPERSRYLERKDGLFRLREIEWDGNLSPAELVARGWEGA